MGETKTGHSGMFAGYTPDDENRPLAAYAGLTGVYNGLFAAALLAARRR